MPVRKLRSIEEIPPALFLLPLAPGNLRLACELSELAARLRPVRFPPCIHKCRSQEEAEWLRESRERDGWRSE